MSFLASLEARAFFTWLRESDSIWAWPTVLTLHTLGIMVLTGASAVLDLRLLGIARHIPIAPLRALFPFIWASFWLNAVTGLLLFCAYATSKAVMPLFFIKMGLVMAGIVTVALIRRELGSGGAAVGAISPRGRLCAGASLVIWLAALTAGRLLAYVEY